MYAIWTIEVERARVESILTLQPTRADGTLTVRPRAERKLLTYAEGLSLYAIQSIRSQRGFTRFILYIIKINISQEKVGS